MITDIEWRDVVGFEGIYWVSNTGLVKRKVKNKVTIKITSTFNHKGYRRVSLYKNDIKINRGVHRLVAQVFIPNPLNLPEVNHKDFNKANNHKTNLEWSTKEDNRNHSLVNGRFKSGEKHGRSVLKTKDVMMIREDNRSNYK